MLPTRSFLLTTLVSTLPLALATFSFNSTFHSNGITIKDHSFNGTIASGVLSAPCASAYSAPINCSNSLVFVGPASVNFTTSSVGTSIPQSAFETLYRDVCTESCYTALQKWRENVVGSCEGDFDSLFSDMYTDGFEDPEKYLESFGLPIKGAGPDVYQLGSAYRYTETQWLNWMYWQKCLRDINTAAYCSITELDTEDVTWPSIENTRYSHMTEAEALARNQSFCDNATCFMQSEMIEVIATRVFQGENATAADLISRIEGMCPDINVTASFPFLVLGTMYPFDDEDIKINTDTVSTAGHGADGIVDLSNSTATSGSSAMPMPVAGKLLHLGCFIVVVGAALIL